MYIKKNMSKPQPPQNKYYKDYAILRERGLDDKQAQKELNLPKYYKSLCSKYEKRVRNPQQLRFTTFKFDKANTEITSIAGQRYAFYRPLYYIMKSNICNKEELFKKGFNQQDILATIKIHGKEGDKFEDYI